MNVSRSGWMGRTELSPGARVTLQLSWGRSSGLLLALTIPIVLFSGCGGGTNGDEESGVEGTSISATTAFSSVVTGSDGTGVTGETSQTSAQAREGCLACHEGIEEIHPGLEISCVTCHGGDPEATTREAAHVLPLGCLGETPGVNDYACDPDYIRFINPADLHIADETCGLCHTGYVERVRKSMMSLTTGHFIGGLFENGVQESRIARYGMMDMVDDDGFVPHERGAVSHVEQIPPFDENADETLLSTQYMDLPRKECATCHLWAPGKARPGEYRSYGCAACHIPYAYDGLSQSLDPTIPLDQPGHPIKHQITRKLGTEVCARCHYRGARIGLSFQGRFQLVEGTPAGPGVPGTTSVPYNGAYLGEEPENTPPDIHFQRGMDCIDCHFVNDVMGDGNIYTHMNMAVEIECTDCHGTPWSYSNLLTSRGAPIENLRKEGGRFILTTKVTGKELEVPQVKDVLNPDHPRYNPRAARAMTPKHLKEEGGLECYACHSAWTVNCYGCHMKRDASQNGFDYFSGETTQGRAIKDKFGVIERRPYHLGWNEEGKVAPYVTGCTVFMSAYDEQGEPIFERVAARSGAGFSGLSFNNIQPHTVQPKARGCVVCHRLPATLGLGSGKYLIAGRYLFLADGTKGMTIVDIFDRTDPKVVGRLEASPISLAVPLTDPIEGAAHYLLAVTGTQPRSLGVFRLDDITSPTLLARLDIREGLALEVGGGELFVADGPAGVKRFDISDPASIRARSPIETESARDLLLAGIDLFVADGPAGIKIIDLSDDDAPRLAAAIPPPREGEESVAIAVHQRYAYTVNPDSGPFGLYVVAANQPEGVTITDVTDRSAPRRIAELSVSAPRSLALYTIYHFGGEGERNEERDYLFVGTGGGTLEIFDITTIDAPRLAAQLPLPGPVDEIVVASHLLPNRKDGHASELHYGFAAVEGVGLLILDLSEPEHPVVVTDVPSEGGALSLSLEVIALDRMIDEWGNRIKDTSYERARHFDREEIVRILRAEIPPETENPSH